ncbi:MAG TPA: glycosyltransferase family 39 protein, partial [Thermoanaerobaculia bacterium]
MAWGWTAGRVQYRDYFDNHAPLFHILTAPFVAALGERANILFYMRALMVPLWVVVLVCTFVVAERLYSRRVAMWSVLLLSLFPPFFLKSLEYRTDNLWTALWMIALLLLFSGPPSVRRSFVIGLVLGCALAVSMKTILLLATVAGAGFITRHVTRDRSPVAAPLLSAAAGLVIVPAIVAGYFIAIGAWSNFVYCVISFNTLIAKTRPSLTFEHIAWPFAVAAIILVARRSPGADERRLFCGVVIALFCVTLLGFWVLISPRDFLPVMPLAAIFSVAVFERFDSRFVICTIAAATLAISLFYYADRFEKRTDEFVTMMN